MAETKRIDIVNGPIIPNILRFCLPLMATGMLQLFYNAADNVIVGQFEGQTALAAVGSTTALINLLINVFMGLAVGASVAVAQDYGAGNKTGVQQTVQTAFLTSILCGLVVGTIGFFFSTTFLRWMDSPENVLSLSSLYLKIYFLGTPASMVYNFCASILRAVGDTKRPLYFLTVSGIANVILNMIFVIVFHMGVAGVALATIISQYISMVLVLVYMHSLNDCCHLGFRELKIYRQKLLRIIQVGLPAGLQGSIFSLSNVVVQSAINSFGSVAMSGNTAAAQLEGFVYIALNAFYHAALTFIGQNVGAGNVQKLHRVMTSCCILVVVVCVVLGGAMYLAGENLLRIYLPIEKNPTTEEAIQTNMDNLRAIQYGMTRLRLILIPYFLCGLMEVMTGCQRGMGMSITPMLTSLIGVCGLRILWLYTLFRMHHTLSMLFLAYPVSWLIALLVHTFFYFRTHRRLLEHHRLAHPAEYEN